MLTSSHRFQGMINDSSKSRSKGIYPTMEEKPKTLLNEVLEQLKMKKATDPKMSISSAKHPDSNRNTGRRPYSSTRELPK